MLRKITIPLFFIALILLLGGCRLMNDQEDIRTEIYNELERQLTAQAMSTAVSRLTQIARPSSSPTFSPTSTQAIPTLTATASPTSTPIILPSNTPKPPTTTPTPIPCNWAEFVKDVTVKDGTRFLPGETFTKIWRIRNIGSCRWKKEYNLVFIKGDQMEGPDNQRFGETVEPGETIDIAVSLRAPGKNGTHIGYWQLSDPAKNIFGIGNNATKPFWVEIIVTAPTRTPVTPSPTPTRTPVTPTPIPVPCNWAEYVKDISIPDGTILKPGETFTKIWRMKNIGTCSWTKNYSLVFVEGDQMSGPVSQNLTTRVDPGQTTDISISLKAPLENGEYTGYWQLHSVDGEIFGIGKNANKPVWVTIEVLVADKTVFNFTRSICAAQWSSEGGNLPCPLIDPNDEGEQVLTYSEFQSLKNTQTFEQGFFSMVKQPKLESNQILQDQALVMKPDEIENGYLTAEYHVIKIEAGDRFRATIGCLADAPKCNVTFQLNYRDEKGNLQIAGVWSESYDGQLTPIDLDLSSLVGKSIQLSLSILDNGSIGDDWGFWYLPRIDRVSNQVPPSDK